jgi:hypothetical protein
MPGAGGGVKDAGQHAHTATVVTSMVEAHFRGDRLIHVVADEEGQVALKRVIPPAAGFVTNVFDGGLLGRFDSVPIFPPGVCGCEQSTDLPMADQGVPCTTENGEHMLKYEGGWYCPACWARLRLGIWYPLENDGWLCPCCLKTHPQPVERCDSCEALGYDGGESDG